MKLLPPRPIPLTPKQPGSQLARKRTLNDQPPHAASSLWHRLDLDRRQQLAQCLAELVRRSYLQAKP